jgi:hypothetical protein
VSEHEIFLPFPTPLARMDSVSEVRSTLIASSLQALKTRDLLDRYTALLPIEHHQTILHCIAGQWFPLAIAFAHYGACDKLGLTLEQQKEIGSDVSRRIHETFLGVVVQMAKGVGVTPWTVLGRGNQLFSRIARGGGLQVTKLGPKDAQIEIACPCSRCRIFGPPARAFTRSPSGCSPSAHTSVTWLHSPASRAS